MKLNLSFKKFLIPISPKPKVISPSFENLAQIFFFFSFFFLMHEIQIDMKRASKLIMDSLVTNLPKIAASIWSTYN